MYKYVVDDQLTPVLSAKYEGVDVDDPISVASASSTYV